MPGVEMNQWVVVEEVERDIDEIMEGDKVQKVNESFVRQNNKSNKDNKKMK